MKKWIISILCVLVVAVGWVMWDLYHTNQTVQQQAASRAIAKAQNHYHIDKVLSVSYYHGTNAYQVVKGERNGVPMYIWVPDQKKKAPYIVRAVRRGISRNKAQQIFQGMRFHVKKIVSIRLGAINSQPIWQVTFLAPNNTYNYISIDFDTGKEIQRILNI
ncbi:DUF5590 domain-containing protein [Sporolactobacillus spathodeae]|uniref:Uncharacterized protein YpmB n=1 Tax=Sporolactobacillus spathodeae TaxID=1465502 RepID=A0ABS2Q885_9BACL|nr:DUF5590 domain-containing protein [Sporolactobacillus spathodeae]MBM7657997.1 uncharacterized protein YpmB [Sporolactobacillus spathodeae]